MVGDTDSIIVQLALEELGHVVHRLVGDNFPTRQTISYSISNADLALGKFHDINSGLSSDNIDTVWLRRPRWPVISETLHPSDKFIAEEESKQFIRSLYQTSWDSAIWVNSLEGKRRAGSKLLQLRVAAELGLIIPDTLVSNNPDEIRKFVKEKNDSAIVKPLMGGDWKENGKRYVTYTAAISTAQLNDNEMIAACPCIYQNTIQKEYEVRATFFGSTAIAVKLNSQDVKSGKLDWRIAEPHTLKISPIELPTEIYKKCISVMNKLGIIHGSFDFAVTGNGDWVFFEVNEAGQFLWLEDYVPSLPVLQTAVEFLLNPSADFIMKNPGRRITIREIVNSDKYKMSLLDDQKNVGSFKNTAII